MFGQSTSERFQTTEDHRPGPGAYDPRHNTWENTEGAGSLKTTSERFREQENSLAPGPGSYYSVSDAKNRGGLRTKRGGRGPGPEDNHLETVLDDLRESFRVLRSGRAPAENKAEQSALPECELSRMRAQLRGVQAKDKAQESCLDIYEAALLVQEEAVAIMPALVERERQAAEASRLRAVEASEKAMTLQAQLDERVRSERKFTHEAGLAQRRADDNEERVQALHAKQAESVKLAQRLTAELSASKRREEEALRQSKQLETALQKASREVGGDKEQSAKKLEHEKQRGASELCTAATHRSLALRHSLGSPILSLPSPPLSPSRMQGPLRRSVSRRQRRSRTRGSAMPRGERSLRGCAHLR